MAKITRPNINVQGFASSPQSQERTTFGTETESTNLADFLTPEFLRGWGVLPVGGKPPYQWFNGAVYLISQLQAYQFQAGIPEWSALQEFHENSITKFSGNIYRSKVDDNTGNQPDTSPTEWDALIAPATTTSAGVVEKATTAESESGASNKFPDAAGVHAAFGQFGIGSAGQPALVDANVISAAGLFAVNASTINVPDGVIGLLLNMSPNDGSTSQMLIDRVQQGNVYVRRSTGNVFQSWILLYSEANNPSSLVGSGYQKLASGLIIQWGRADVPNGGTVTYPIAFPNAVFNIHLEDLVVDDVSALQLMAPYNETNLTSFGVRKQATEADAIHWFAVGY